MEYGNSNFETKYSLERVIANLGRRKANRSTLRFSEITWNGQEQLDIRIWYDTNEEGPGLPGKGIVMSQREGILLFYGLLDYFRNIVADVERTTPRPDPQEAEAPKGGEIPVRQTAYSSF